jgi:predicted DCC family thiol-disulfide oxidoreductase YuxK
MKNFCGGNSEITEKTEDIEEIAPPAARPTDTMEGRAPTSPPESVAPAPPSTDLCSLETRPDGPRGWIFYDADCRYCTAAAQRFKGLFARRGFHFTPLQTSWAQKRLGLTPGAPLREIRVLTQDRRDLGGADAVIFLAGQIWWSKPLGLLGQLPGIYRAVDRAYHWIAAHRGCTHIACHAARCAGCQGGDPAAPERLVRLSGSTGPITAWLGLVILPSLVLITYRHVAPWLFMWMMVAAIFLDCKWLTFWRTKLTHPLSPARVLGYFFLWPGMDAARFLDDHPPLVSGTTESRRAIFASLKLTAGAALLFCVAPLTPNALIAGWIGMIGMILILHFGLFDLAAIAWRTAGVEAKPIMNAPLQATSLSDFWGRRWNGAFNQLVLTVFFRRLARAIGSIRATLTAFLVSGLIHELVISLPAGAGYGLPTAYFLLQGWGVIAQRSPLGNQLGIRSGIRGRVFTMLITAGPVFWLFHPPFVRNVILPFMKVIQAL